MKRKSKQNLKKGLNLIRESYTQKDKRKSMACYTKGYLKLADAALSGEPEAQYEIGLAYEDSGVFGSCEESAFSWYLRAAKNNFAPACNSVGFCYNHGVGVKKNIKEGIKWYKKGAKLGDFLAEYNLGLCFEKGEGELKKNEKKAFDLYLRSAKQKHEDAVLKVIYYYENAKGIKKDIKAANRWKLKIS